MTGGSWGIPFELLAAVAVYSIVVLAVALLVEKRRDWQERVSRSPMVYALSLAVFNTTWSFYGSVGLAARTGYFFMTVCLGVVLSSLMWWTVLRKIVRIKAVHRITSIADFVSARYNRSQLVAVLVTLGALVGSLPYVALQMKAVLSTLAVAGDAQPGTTPVWMEPAGPMLVAFMSLFTILVGVRRLDPTERHQGIIFAVALEAVVKLGALVAAGVYVTYFMFDGFGDIFTRVAAMPERPMTGIADGTGSGYMRWMTMLVLSMFAVLFLPRQFHVAAVENSDERHIRTAAWVFPGYQLVLNLFLFPIAMGGLLLGLPAGQADTFVLRLPHLAGNMWLAILVFIGGFSAGMSMIVVSAMTMATMITNHVVLPLINIIPALSGLKKSLLQCRWAVVVAYLCLGYTFNLMVGDSYILVNMGIISFVAALQFVPAILGGLFWREGNRNGALAGMGGGFAVWAYTMLLPAFARSGWLPSGIVESGPLGLGFLHPEALFGITALDPLSHAVFWSMVANVGAYVLCSLCTEASDEEDETAGRFVDALVPVLASSAERGAWEAHVSMAEKRRLLVELFETFYTHTRAELIADRCIQDAGLEGASSLTIKQLMDLYAEAERVLSGVVGSAAAYKAMRQGHMYTPRETMELSEVYADILAELKLSPEDLAKRVDYHQEREALLSRHARELVDANQRLREEVQERRRAQEEMREAEYKFRSIYENAVEGIFQTTPQGRVLDMNPAALKFFGYETAEQIRDGVTDLGAEHYVDASDRERFLTLLREKRIVESFETRLKDTSGVVRWVELSARGIFDEGGELFIIEGFLQDIDARKSAERELMRANRYIENIVESMPSVVIAVDGGGGISLMNKAAERIVGLSTREVRGKGILEVYPSMVGVEEAIAKALARQKPIRLGRRSRFSGGVNRHEDVMIYPLVSDGVEDAVVRVDDVTERVLMEEVMIQTEKMMSVGGLAAGMAHEINNPLGGILQAVQNIERRVMGELPANKRAAEALGCSLDTVQGYFERRGVPGMLQGIRESGERAAGIVANMLEFSRQSDTSRISARVCTVLDKTVELASKDYNLAKSYDFRKINIIREYCEDDLEIWCTPVEIEQVLFNLLKNAAQAMADHGISGEEPTILLATGVEDGMARIEVTDNGPGMDEHTARRVFEPFFTTKEAGVGTGLGLSVSYFIVTTKHGGRFTVQSEPGVGTTFIIHLPLYSGQDRLESAGGEAAPE